LKLDPLAPKLTHFDSDSEGNDINVPKTVVRFSKKSPVLFTGNSIGQVGVYRTFGLEHGPVLERDQQERLISAITKDEFTETSQDKSKDADEE